MQKRLRHLRHRQPADPKIYEQQVRDHLKYLDYAPLVFLSAASGKGIEALFKKIELVARERRKRVTTGQMNRFLAKVDFQQASVPMNRRVRIYYMTQAAVAPPTFVLFTDKDVKLHFAFERFLANQIRDAFGFIGSPIWFKTRPETKSNPKPSLPTRHHRIIFGAPFMRSHRMSGNSAKRTVTIHTPTRSNDGDRLHLHAAPPRCVPRPRYARRFQYSPAHPEPHSPGSG